MYRGSSIPLVSADTLVDDKPSHDNFNIRAAADFFHLYKLKSKSYFSKTRKNAEKSNDFVKSLSATQEKRGFQFVHQIIKQLSMDDTS
jgi:hypothetical protein